jgi:hypothetical protein
MKDKDNEGCLVERWMDQNKVYRFEGDVGVDNLNQLCKALGYDASGFKYGSSLEQFLSDNPGACEAIVDFISENQKIYPEFPANLEDESEDIAEADEDEEDDS